LTIVEHYETR